jgi:hypothetical protein
VKQIDRPGAGPGSLTNDGLRYEVLDGQGVVDHLSDLWLWAHDTCLPIVSASAGKPLKLSEVVLAAVNVNVIRGQGEQYELHVDSVPYTLIVWATEGHKGGELLCQWPLHSAEVLITPRVGSAVLFEGKLTPHAVMPMQDDSTRISIPIALEIVGVENERDADLSSFLYAKP